MAAEPVIQFSDHVRYKDTTYAYVINYRTLLRVEIKDPDA